LRIFYQRLWDLAFGQPDPEHHEVILLVSLLYYSCAMLLGRGLRHCVRRLITPTLGKSVASCLLDLVTTFQVCACSLENGVIRKHYGMPAYLCTLLLLGVWHSGTLGDACGNPCGSWRQFVLGQARLSGTLIRMSLQMLAGAMAYRYARCCWWRLGLSSEHEMRYRITGCSSDLAVPVGAGFSIEAFATGLDLLVGLCVFSSGLRWERFQPLIKVLISTVLTYCGLHLTGMYVNPANATAQTFGCEGSQPWEHVTVYWLGPLAGVTGAVQAHRRWLGGHPAVKLDSVAADVAGAALRSSDRLVRRRLYSDNNSTDCLDAGVAAEMSDLIETLKGQKQL
ncbi:hypothetical protein BOX15_Mlig008191g3, partial [Macrostomum lignano]